MQSYPSVCHPGVDESSPEGACLRDGLNRRRLLAGLLAVGGVGHCALAAAVQSLLLAANAVPGADMTAYQQALVRFREGAAAERRYDPLREPLPLVEQAALDASNATRLAEGAGTMRLETDLLWIARFYAAQLADGAVFSHVDGGGRRSADRIAQLHRRQVGGNAENLYANSIFDPDRPEAAGQVAVANLMQSPGHRRNLIDGRWTHAAMGTAIGADGLVLVQLFAERAALLRADMPATLARGAALPPDAQMPGDGSFDGIALVPDGRDPTGEDFATPGMLGPITARGLHRSFFARSYERTASTARYIIHPGPMVIVR